MGTRSGSLGSLARRSFKEVFPDASKYESDLASQMVCILLKTKMYGDSFTFYSYKGWSCTIRYCEDEMHRPGYEFTRG